MFQCVQKLLEVRIQCLKNEKKKKRKKQKKKEKNFLQWFCEVISRTIFLKIINFKILRLIY